ncbi:NAD-dependent protein deacetylase [Anaerolineales bacterium]|nr:NAD-dependent protein deacetylase [Anaerolineales bacterium]
MSLFSPQTQAAIDFAADLIRQSKHLVLLTGAGLSTPSGIPDFRSTGTGLWSRDEPMEVASLSTFRTAPERFFKWFQPLASQIYNAQPNPAHVALARLEKAGGKHAIITQNIDMLHQKAGSKTVIEMHGTMKTLTCTQCYHRVEAASYIDAFVDNGRIPRCPKCGHILKPDVILFGEQLPQAAWSKAQREARQCDLMLVIGSSLEVLPVAGLPMQALDRGAHLIIVNNAPTYINIRADAVFMEDVAVIIPAIAEKVLNG